MQRGISIRKYDSLTATAIKRLFVYFYIVPRVISFILYYLAESRSNYSLLMLFVLMMNFGLLIWYVFVNNDQKILPLKNEIWELTIPSIILLFFGNMFFMVSPDAGTALAY